LPSNTKALLSYVLYPTSFLAFRRSALELALPIPRALVSGMKHWMAERDYDLRYARYHGPSSLGGIAPLRI
jgi:hypothetical protein